MKFHVIIPARYASQRLPGKPLLDINGKPMIQRVVECARQSSAQSVVVATDDHRIAEVVEGFGAKVCMTKVEHESGTDRLQEVVSQLGLGNDEIVVNLQGDEPLMPAAVIEQVANNLAQNPEAGVATLSEPLYHQHEVMNPNIVKAVCDQNGMALYFSRAPIPWHRELYTQEALSAKTSAQDFAPVDGESQENKAALPVLAQRHIGIYAYRVALLHNFVSWPMAALEATEKLEQLRVLANGGKIHIQEACQQVPGGVDTQADLDRIRQFLAN